MGSFDLINVQYVLHLHRIVVTEIASACVLLAFATCNNVMFFLKDLDKAFRYISLMPGGNAA